MSWKVHGIGRLTRKLIHSSPKLRRTLSTGPGEKTLPRFAATSGSKSPTEDTSQESESSPNIATFSYSPLETSSRRNFITRCLHTIAVGAFSTGRKDVGVTEIEFLIGSDMHVAPKISPFCPAELFKSAPETTYKAAVDDGIGEVSSATANMGTEEAQHNSASATSPPSRDSQNSQGSSGDRKAKRPAESRASSHSKRSRKSSRAEKSQTSDISSEFASSEHSSNSEGGGSRQAVESSVPQFSSVGPAVVVSRASESPPPYSTYEEFRGTRVVELWPEEISTPRAGYGHFHNQTGEGACGSKEIADEDAADDADEEVEEVEDGDGDDDEEEFEDDFEDDDDAEVNNDADADDVYEEQSSDEEANAEAYTYAYTSTTTSFAALALRPLPSSDPNIDSDHDSGYTSPVTTARFALSVANLATLTDAYRASTETFGFRFGIDRPVNSEGVYSAGYWRAVQWAMETASNVPSSSFDKSAWELGLDTPQFFPSTAESAPLSPSPSPASDELSPISVQALRVPVAVADPSMAVLPNSGSNALEILTPEESPEVIPLPGEEAVEISGSYLLPVAVDPAIPFSADFSSELVSDSSSDLVDLTSDMLNQASPGLSFILSPEESSLYQSNSERQGSSQDGPESVDTPLNFRILPLPGTPTVSEGRSEIGPLGPVPVPRSDTGSPLPAVPVTVRPRVPLTPEYTFDELLRLTEPTRIWTTEDAQATEPLSYQYSYHRRDEYHSA